MNNFEDNLIIHIKKKDETYHFDDGKNKFSFSKKKEQLLKEITQENYNEHISKQKTLLYDIRQRGSILYETDSLIEELSELSLSLEDTEVKSSILEGIFSILSRGITAPKAHFDNIMFWMDKCDVSLNNPEVQINVYKGVACLMNQSYPDLENAVNFFNTFFIQTEDNTLIKEYIKEKYRTHSIDERNLGDHEPVKEYIARRLIKGHHFNIYEKLGLSNEFIVERGFIEHEIELSLEKIRFNKQNDLEEAEKEKKERYNEIERLFNLKEKYNFNEEKFMKLLTSHLWDRVLNAPKVDVDYFLEIIQKGKYTQEFFYQSVVQERLILLLDQKIDTTSLFTEEQREQILTLIDWDFEEAFEKEEFTRDPLLDKKFDSENHSKKFLAELSFSIKELQKRFDEDGGGIKISSIDPSPYSKSLYVYIGDSFVYQDEQKLEKNVIRISDHYQYTDTSTRNVLDVRIFNPAHFAQYTDRIVEAVNEKLNTTLEKVYQSEYTGEDARLGDSPKGGEIKLDLYLEDIQNYYCI